MRFHILIGNDPRTAVSRGEFEFEEMPRAGEIIRFKDGDHAVVGVIHVIEGSDHPAASAVVISPDKL